MSETTILVIDDSATIRRFVDTTLSPAGYRVVLAASAEEGLQQAQAVHPDVILLDHQLPGTTGAQVCQELQSDPHVGAIPVVVSSTLRKKAYAEYTDMPNVVDMLPKPYTAELLITTISNALETGKLIVQSQAQGTAVPEMIDAVEDSDLSGTFAEFTFRQVIDFLNNGRKTGMLEAETDAGRVRIYLAGGRIQAASGTGIDAPRLMASLPESLRELSPVLKLTLSGRMCAELDGLVELLDRKVLDPRLLKSLLRYQAAQLLWMCFHSRSKSFCFRAQLKAPPLFRKLPLDLSLAALLIEAALTCRENELPDDAAERYYVRADVRGQNVDRAGLAARHLKVLSAVGTPVAANKLADQLGFDRQELLRVLYGFQLAELIDARAADQQAIVIAVEHDAEGIRSLQQAFRTAGDRCAAKLIRDKMALQILLKRTDPHVILLGVDTPDEVQFAGRLKQHFVQQGKSVRLIGLHCSNSASLNGSGHGCDMLVARPYSADDILNALSTSSTCAETHCDNDSPELIATE